MTYLLAKYSSIKKELGLFSKRTGWIWFQEMSLKNTHNPMIRSLNINYTYLISALLCIYPPSLQAQNLEKIESLKAKLLKESDQEKVVDRLNDIAWEFRVLKDSCEVYLKQAIDFSEGIGYEKGKGDAFVIYGVLRRNAGEYVEAEKSFRQALQIREKLGKLGPIVSVYNHLGTVCRFKGKFRQAITFYDKGLAITDETVKARDRNKLVNGLAICYLRLGEYQRALTNNLKDVANRKEMGDRKGLAASLLTSGNIYHKIKNYVQAEKSFKESLKIVEDLNIKDDMARAHLNLGVIFYEQKQTRKSIYHYQEALTLKSVIEADVLANLYKNLGAAYFELNQPDSTKFFYEKSSDILSSTDNVRGLSEIEYALGAFHAEQGQQQAALNHFNQALEVLKVNKLSNPTIELSIIDRLSQLYNEIGEYELAFQWKELYENLKDSLNTLILGAANYKSNYEEQQRKIEKIESELEIQQLQKMKIIYLLIGIALFLIFGATVALMTLRQRRRKRETEREIDDLLRDQEINNNYARIEGQDEERRRIAQDLHDRLGSMLSTVKLYFSALDNKMDLIRLENREQYSKANQLLDEACDEVRKVSHDLHSGVLKKFGLKAQLEELAETINETKQIELRLLTHKFGDRLETKLEVNIYRIIQELIGNALKHARASILSVQLNRFGEIIHILVEDNGVGFSEELVSEKGGLGLSGVKSRVEALNGKMNIDSTAGRGTTITIDIPYISKIALLEEQ